MGNEASLEGGEGSLSELSEGLSADGKGGFIRTSTGERVDLNQLSEAERNQLAAAMSRRPGEQPGCDAATSRATVSAGTSKGPTGLSKSRTIDAFAEGPASRPKPGRSPSSLSLFESRFRQEPKDSSESRTSMFSSGFLSGANPLSAVSSAVSSSAANISKLNPFGDEEEEEPAIKLVGKPPGPRKGPQQQGPRPPQGQGPPKGQGPPQQGPPKNQGPSQQGPPKSHGPPQQGPPKSQGPPQQRGGPPPQGPGKPGGPGPQQQGPLRSGGPPQQGSAKGDQKSSTQPGPTLKSTAGPDGQSSGPAKNAPVTGKSGTMLCPLCNATELNMQAKDQPPNFSTCTQCRKQVCSLCGFSPPDSAGKEWLCLNCQMQRALGGAEHHGPPMMKPQLSKESSAPPSPQRKEPPLTGPPLKGESKRPPMLTKQKSIADSGKIGTPPVTPNLKSPGPLSPNAPLSPKGPLGSQPGSQPGSRPGSQPGSPGPKVGSPKIDPKTGRPIQQQQGSPARSAPPPKQDTGFFGGFGLGGLTDMPKPPSAASQAAESVTGKLFSGFGGTKPQGPSSQPTESVTGKLFGGLGSLTEGAKPPAAEAVSGKMFGFGSSLLSSATNLISTNPEDENGESPPGSPLDTPPGSPPDSAPGSPPDSPIDSGAGSPPGTPPDSGSDSPPDTPPPSSKKPDSSKVSEPPDEAPTTDLVVEPKAPDSVPAQMSASCPLCKTQLNIGSEDAPNYSTCTECKKTVCNLCGFNPMPHLGENEWLCLNCQTQRALSGQLGDMSSSPKTSPAKQPLKPAPKASSPTSNPVPPSASPIPDAPPSPASKAPAASAESSPSINHAQAEQPHLNSDKRVDPRPSEQAARATEVEDPVPESKTEVLELNMAQTPDMSEKAGTLNAPAKETQELDITSTPACSSGSFIETVEENVDHPVSPSDDQKPEIMASGEKQIAVVESEAVLVIVQSTESKEPEVKLEENFDNSSSPSDEQKPESINTGEKQMAIVESESVPLVEQSITYKEPQAQTKESVDSSASPSDEKKHESINTGEKQMTTVERDPVPLAENSIEPKEPVAKTGRSVDSPSLSDKQKTEGMNTGENQIAATAPAESVSVPLVEQIIDSKEPEAQTEESVGSSPSPSHEQKPESINTAENQIAATAPAATGSVPLVEQNIESNEPETRTEESVDNSTSPFHEQKPEIMNTGGNQMTSVEKDADPLVDHNIESKKPEVQTDESVDNSSSPSDEKKPEIINTGEKQIAAATPAEIVSVPPVEQSIESKEPEAQTEESVDSSPSPSDEQKPENINAGEMQRVASSESESVTLVEHSIESKELEDQSKENVDNSSCPSDEPKSESVNFGETQMASLESESLSFLEGVKSKEPEAKIVENLDKSNLTSGEQKLESINTSEKEVATVEKESVLVVEQTTESKAEIVDHVEMPDSPSNKHKSECMHPVAEQMTTENESFIEKSIESKEPEAEIEEKVDNSLSDDQRPTSITTGEQQTETVEIQLGLDAQDANFVECKEPGVKKDELGDDSSCPSDEQKSESKNTGETQMTAVESDLIALEEQSRKSNEAKETVDNTIPPSHEQKADSINTGYKQTATAESESVPLIGESIKCKEPEVQIKESVDNSSSLSDEQKPDSISTGEKQKATVESDLIALKEQSRKSNEAEESVDNTIPPSNEQKADDINTGDKQTATAESESVPLIGESIKCKEPEVQMRESVDNSSSLSDEQKPGSINTGEKQKATVESDLIALKEQSRKSNEAEESVDNTIPPSNEQKADNINTDDKQTATAESESVPLIGGSIKCREPEVQMRESVVNSSSLSDEQKPDSINTGEKQKATVESESVSPVEQCIESKQPEQTMSPCEDLDVAVDSRSPVPNEQAKSKDLEEEKTPSESHESVLKSRDEDELEDITKNAEITSQPEEKKLNKESEAVVTREGSPASPSDLAKLESTVLPILEAQSTTVDLEKSNEIGKGRRRLQVLPMSPQQSSEEDSQGEPREKDSIMTAGPKTERKKLSVPAELQDSFEDSSESEHLTLPKKVVVGGEKQPSDSPVSVDEVQLIRTQAPEMSPDTTTSPTNKERDQEQKNEQDDKEKSEKGRGRRLLKNTSISPEDDTDVKSLTSSAKSSEEVAAGVRHFKTIELTSTTTVRPTFDDVEPESLTDSPEDRSRGEGSSSLHASSFTPGTSPTSLSSLDEDSDSSSPSHTRSSGEGKQHRKAKHRQPGQMLPTIEDSSEEEELREEEELLREQEKQKSSGKKSKKDKEDIRAQRRRERPKTPPSNLSPIEDASPTEELRQEAEMEEIRRSSCSDFSPSMESEPEGFEVNPEKIAAVHKVYKLPTSVCLYSPTDEHHNDTVSKEGIVKKPLKSADEAYEEIMLKAKSPVIERVELPPCKESLYGNVLIEDYAYESLVEDKCDEKDKMPVPETPKQLRSPDEVYEDMMQKKMEMMLKEQNLKESQTIKDILQPEIIIPPPESHHGIISTGGNVTLGKDGKPLLDAETAYEELMKRQKAVLTPGTSPTQPCPDSENSEKILKCRAPEDTMMMDTGSEKRLFPIPDLRVIQCSSGEEEPDEDSVADHIPEKAESASKIISKITAETEPISVVPKGQHCVAPASEKDINSVSSFENTKSNHQVTSEIPNIHSLFIDSETTQKDESGVVDLSKSSPSCQTNLPSTSTVSGTTKSPHPVVVSVSPLPTVPQYIPSAPSVVSTAPPVPPKPAVLCRGLSQEKTDIPMPPPLPPQTLPKPTVYPKKIQPQVLPCTSVSMTSAGYIPLEKQSVGTTHKPHIPPPVPPKPSSIPAGLTFSHRPGESVKPPIAPKPMTFVHPPSPSHSPARPTVLTTESTNIALNLSPSVDSRTGTISPKSPLSPRHTKTVHETYVVITLPSQPSSPVDGIQSQAPASSGFASPTMQPQASPHSPQQQSHTQSDPLPQQTTKVPLAFTRITESIESQEICGPEKVVSSMSHVYEAISASAEPPVPLANGVTQVVTTELQRTTVSVVHERVPSIPTPRSFGVSSSPENLKTQPQNSHVYHAGEVVDLRTPKMDAETAMKGVDLSSESRRQSLVNDGGPRQTSAVQSSVVNLSTEPPASVSGMSDNITILTCTATIASGNDASLTTSLPLQLTTAKSFEPVSQIIYRPVDTQPEKPMNLSTSVGKVQTPVTIAPTSVTSGFGASVPPRLETCVSGAVDLTTAKPVQTVVSVDKSTADVVTAVITEEDGKPVDLTAGRRAVCCDVYKLPFAGSCTTQQSTPLPEDRFGYRDDHYQYNRSSYGMKGFVGIKPSMSDTNLADAGLFFYKSKNSYDFSGAIEGAVDLTSGKMSEAGEAVDYSRVTGTYSGMTVPQFSQTRITSATGTPFVVTSVLRSSNGIVYSSVAAPIPSTYAITTQPGSIFSTSYNTLSGMHTSDTMPSLSSLQNQPITRSQSFVSTLVTTTAEEQEHQPLNLEIVATKDKTVLSEITPMITTVGTIDTYTDASLEAIAASLEALSSPMVPGDGQYQMERELLELEKIKQQRLAEELEWERQEIQRFREQEQLLVQKELEELQAMKQHILCQQEEERQAHLMMQKETYAQQQQQLEQIQRLQEQLRQQLEEQKLRQMYPGDATDAARQEALLSIAEHKKNMDSGVQTDEEDNAEQGYTGRRKRVVKKSVDSCVQTDDEDQDEWEGPARSRRSRPRGVKYTTAECGGQVSVQALTEISVQTDSSGTVKGHSVQVDARVEYSDSERNSSPQRDRRRLTPLEIGQSSKLKVDSASLQVLPGPPKSPKVLYSPISPCVSPSKSLEFVSYEKSLGDTSPQRIHAPTLDLSKAQPINSRTPKIMQRSMSDPKPMSPTGEEKANPILQRTDGHTGKASPTGTPPGTQKKVKRTLPNPPSEEETTTTGQTTYSTASARRRLCRSTNMARAKILQDIDRELDLVERESSKLRKKQAELDEEEKEIDAKLRYLEMGINRRKDALLKEREKRERAYLQSVAEDRDYMSDSEVSNIRETRHGGGGEEVGGHGLERPHTAPQSELEQFVPPQTKQEAQYSKYSQYQYPQQTMYQHSLYQPQQPYQSQSIYSSVPSLTASQQQSYHQMLLLQQKARQQAALLSELDATKIATNYDVIRRQPDASSYLGGKYGSHLDLRPLEEHGGSIAGSPMPNVSADSFYTDVEHHQTSRSYLLLEDAAELTKGSSGLSDSTYTLAEKELAKAERLLRRTAADVGTDYLESSQRLSAYGKTQEDEEAMEEPYELKLLKQQLKQEFRRSAAGTESLDQLAGLPHHYYAPGSAVSSSSYRPFSKTEKYSISRLTLEKQAAKQLPAAMIYQKQKPPIMDSKLGKYSSAFQDTRTLETDYSSYLGSSAASPRSSRLLQDEITFGLRKNIAEQQKYLGSSMGSNLAGSLNVGQSLNLSSSVRTSLGEESSYPSGSRSRPSSRPTSVYGLDLSIKRDISSSSLRLKAESEASTETSAYQTPSGRTKPTSLPIGPGGRGRIPIVAQNSEEESPLSPVGQPMGMARASAGPLPPISADSRDQFGSCLSLQDPQQQQQLRDEQTRGRGYVLMDDLQDTMSDSEAYHLHREETDWFVKPPDGQLENCPSPDRRQMKSMHFAFPHVRVKLQRDPKDRSVSGNGLGIRVVGGKEVPGSNGEIGAYVAKVLPGGAAEQTGKIVEGMQVLEWNGIVLTSKTYEEVQGLVGQQCGEAELCVRLDINMLSDSESCSQHLELQDPTKGDRQRSPGVDPKQLAAELQKVSQQQTPASSVASLAAGDKGPLTISGTASTGSSAIPSPGQPSSPSVGKKRHSKTTDTAKVQTHPVTGEIQLQINYDKQLGNLIVHVLQARNLSPRDNNGYSDPFVKVYLLPGRGAENRRRSKHAQKSLNPEWNQTVIYKNIHLEQLRKKTLEVSVWDYDKCSSNDFLGEVLIDLSNATQLDNVPRWLPLKEQSDGEHHRRSGRQHSPKTSAHGSQHSPKNQDLPKSSVTKSRSHGIFPDPAKDTQIPTIEKSHSSPGTSKPTLSEGQGRSHGTSRTSSKSGAARTHHEDTVATNEASTPQRRHLQPTENGRLSLRYHRHSVVGVLTIQRPLCEFPANESRDGRHLTLRKAISEERPQMNRASRGHRVSDAPVTAASLDSGLSGSAYSLLEEENGTAVDSAIFQIPRFGKLTNGTDGTLQAHGETEGKTHVMGEIKIALKKEIKTEGEHLVLEILQCRNITYKFKSPDHLPDLYVKLYVVNVATQKRIIKKKTRVCRHDREPSFNETFRFCMNPTGHSLQLFLVSNGGKFVKKTLIGEAYVWLDKVDLRKRVVSWHKLLASSAQIHS